MAQRKPANQWSRTGKTSIKTQKKLNWKKYLPIILMVAAVGGFFVWRSFAAPKKPPAYQYSVYTCANFNKDNVPLENRCINESAEALTFRMYQGVYDKNPDTKGYKLWTQKLAGDRTQPTDAAKTIVSKAKINKSANKEFVGSLYVRMHDGKKIDKEGQAYYKKQLDTKKWSRGQVIAHFATQTAAKKANQRAFAKFIKTAPRVAIVQTAQKDQDVRLVKSTQAANEAKRQYDSIKDLPSASRTPRDQAANQAKKNPPNSGDLQAISGNQNTVKGNLAKAKTALSKIKEQERINKAFYDRAKAVAAYALDISDSSIKKQYDNTVKYRKDTETAIAGLNKLISEIAASYKAAEGKYEAELKRKISTDGTGSTPADITGPSGEVLHPANCSDKSLQRIATKIIGGIAVSKECIAWFQYHTGSTVDGRVGTQTRSAALVVQKNNNNGGYCSEYQVKRGTVCVNEYIGATNVDCPADFNDSRVDYENSRKYACKHRTTGALRKASSITCADSWNYSPTQVGSSVYFACTRD